MKYLIIMLLIGTSFWAQAQDIQKKSRKQLRAERAALIEMQVDSVMNSTQYTFLARTASSVSMQQVQLTSNYDLTVRGDSVFVYLPYFGVAYQAGFNTEGGVRVNTIMDDYVIKKQKNSYEVTFKARNDGDTYRFNLSVSTSGYCNLLINSNNRQAISYTGLLKDVDQ